MDIFVDKLSQKSTAEEIIRANTAADVEELNKWKRQAADSADCLTKMHKLVDEGLTKLACFQVENAELNSLTEENAGGIRLLQEEMKNLKADLETIQEHMDNIGGMMAEQVESVAQALDEKKEVSPAPALMERLDILEESVHKECVKVYRNVQAVLVEESGKQAVDVDRTKSHVKHLKKGVITAMVFSIAAAVFALAGLVLQILNMLHILVF